MRRRHRLAARARRGRRRPARRRHRRPRVAVDLDQAMSLADLYAEACATPSDIWLHLPRMVELVEALNAQHVIELGTRGGVSTIAWLHALEQTGGRLTSVDIDPTPCTLGDYSHWGVIVDDDCDPAVTSRLDPADIVFIDTSHLYEPTVRELNIYRWLVKPGGVIVCHDTMLEQPMDAPARPRFPVRTAIEEFVAANGFEWINYPDCWGLG